MDDQGLWVFGYGSLIWNPEFYYQERHIAVMHGYHRSFCMHSIHHRGTEADPGLVLALDKMKGASCTGVAFYVVPENRERTLTQLRERELISSAYYEDTLPVTLQNGETVDTVAYIIDPDHVQYCGGMALEDQAKIIAKAVGGRGPNWEYLVNTADHLHELGINDPDLDWLSARVRHLRENSGG